MDHAYIVRVQVPEDIFQEYAEWLMQHIEGYAANGIRGMMEIRHNGRYLFPSVEVYTTDAIDGYHILTIYYFTDDPQNIEDYLEHYAPAMRADIPEALRKGTKFNRFISRDESLTPVGEVNEDMERIFAGRADENYNLASFEIYR